jgi:hypothetical protein
MLKAGFGQKLGQALSRFAEAVSPMSPQAVKGAMGFGEEAAVTQGRAYIGSTWKAIKGSDKVTVPQMVGGYFKGQRAEDIAMKFGDSTALQAAGITGTVGVGNMSAAQVMARRAWQRTGVVAGAGVVGLNQMFGSDDSLIGRTTGFATKVGAHTGIGMGMRGLGHPMLGTGYMAWAGINMLRGGDNLGPF